MNAALPNGAAVLGAGALLALLIPGKPRSTEAIDASSAALAAEAT
jgi:hypothetical protein